jgi:hypothetical protein
MNGTKEQNLIDTLAIRSIKQKILTDNIGHYGLV